MRLTALALGLLLCACTVGGDNASENAEANGAVSTGTVNATGNAATDGEAAPPGSQQPQPAQPGAPAPLPSGSVDLSVAPTRVAAGATMTLTLRNGSRGQIGYNLCTSAIETSAGRTVPSDRVCTMELRTLEPGRSANYSYELPRRIAAGSYRFVTNVGPVDGGVRSVVRSNNFEVR